MSPILKKQIGSKPVNFKAKKIKKIQKLTQLRSSKRSNLNQQRSGSRYLLLRRDENDEQDEPQSKEHDPRPGLRKPSPSTWPPQIEPSPPHLSEFGGSEKIMSCHN